VLRRYNDTTRRKLKPKKMAVEERIILLNVITFPFRIFLYKKEEAQPRTSSLYLKTAAQL